MAGCLIMPTDRCAVSTVSLVTGTAVTGYPITNLQDSALWKVAKITTVAGACRILFQMPAAPSSTANTDWLIGGLFIGNHNLDGATYNFVRHSANVYASGSNVISNTTLDSNIGHPYLFKTFSATAYQYWWLNITGAPVTAIIGKVSFGPIWDLGTFVEAPSISFLPNVASGGGGRGYVVTAKSDDAIVTHRLTFDDPSAVTANASWVPDVATGDTYPTYNTLERHLAQDRQLVHNAGSAVYSGYSAAGGARPFPWTRGDSYGTSSAGRPAFYGRWACTMAPFAPRAAVLSAEITEELPLGPRIKPYTN